MLDADPNACTKVSESIHPRYNFTTKKKYPPNPYIIQRVDRLLA